MQYSINKQRGSRSWDLTTDLDGEQVVVHSGLTSAEAKVAMYRIMYGLPPVDSTLVVAAPVDTHELPLAA